MADCLFSSIVKSQPVDLLRPTISYPKEEKYSDTFFPMPRVCPVIATFINPPRLFNQ